MSVGLTQEQQQLRAVVRDYLEERSPESEVRRLMETTEGYDPAVWKQMAQELQLQGLAIPEAYGGSGYGLQELALVFEAMGETLLCAPFLSTVGVAAQVLLACEDVGMQEEWLPRIAAGEAIATLALAEESGLWDAEGITARAEERDGGWQLTGAKLFVLDGHLADLLLVVARTGRGVSLFAVEGQAPGLTRTPLETLDLTRKQARVDLAETPARMLGHDGGGWGIVGPALDRALLCLGAEDVGGAQRCLDTAVDYARTRVQFGRPIGSFQAIKHKCADMLVGLESARSGVYYGAWAAERSSLDELALAASATKAHASDAYVNAAAQMIQIHGGIGFTWEHPAHLYFKRAKSSQLLFGDSAFHRERVARSRGL